MNKFGPSLMVSISGALIAAAWVINAYANSLALLYLGAAVGGVGAGDHLRRKHWQCAEVVPERRGLAAGLTAAGFGAGFALTIIPIAGLIKSSGYQAAFLWFGLGQGIVVMLVAMLLRAPGDLPAKSRHQLRPQFSRRGTTIVGGR